MITCNLAELNKLSNIDIHFLKDELLSKLVLTNSFNLIFSKNGIYFNQHFPFGDSFIKIGIPYTNLGLQEIKQNQIISINIPKPSVTFLENILNIFKYVQNKTKNEFMIIIYWDKQKKEFVSDYLQQIVTPGSVKYDYSEKYEQDENYIKYLEIHSHHSMSASFSAIDDNDEKSKGLCYYGVIGNLSEHSTIHSMGSKFRIWNGFAFTEIKLTEVFEFPSVESKPIQDIDVIDNILKVSEEIKKPIVGWSNPNTTTMPNKSTQFSPFDFKKISTQFLSHTDILLDEAIFINNGETEFNLIVDSKNGIIILQFKNNNEEIVVDLMDEIEIKQLLYYHTDEEIKELIEELNTIYEWNANE